MDIHFELNGDQFVWFGATKKRMQTGANTVSGLRKRRRFLKTFVLVDASRNNESRDAAIGFDATGRLLYVVHIEFEASFIRIISARRAEPDEELNYAD